MFNRFFQVFLLLLLPAATVAQSLSLSVNGNTADNDNSTFALKKGEVTINSSQIKFLSSRFAVDGFLSYGISFDRSVVGLLTHAGNDSKAIVLDSKGDTLSYFPITSLTSSDPSLAIFPSDDGSILVRDNIANFSFYNSLGEIITSVSSSSQSKGGEAISEVAMATDAETVVIYTPKIKRSGELGSSVQVIDSGMNTKTIYSSTDRYIKDLVVSDDGQFIITVTAKEGTEDEIVIMDRFGNELNKITDEAIKGVNLSSGAEYITVYTSKRVKVLDALSGARAGSTSFDSPVVLAQYFPEDDILMVLTGNYSPNQGTLSDTEFHAVDFEKRKVARKQFGSVLGFNSSISRQFVREGSNVYQLKGATKLVDIDASF